MNKALLVIAILALVVVAGCGPTVVKPSGTAQAPASGDAATVQEATSNLADNSNGVQIGEMV